ncbi:MAG: histidinol dehydrogenase [Chloroflexota bacterium]
MRTLRSEQARAFLERPPLEGYRLPPQVRARIKKAFGHSLQPRGVVERIIDGVRKRGDEALLDFTRLLDGVELPSLEVPREEWERAVEGLPAPLLSALKMAAKRIEAYHRCFRPLYPISTGGGMGYRVRPLKRVGLYIPGGMAAYPSTVLMSAIPARVAGVGEVLVVSPPQKDGSLPAPVLAACSLAGVNRVFRVGGAQAVAALALGTGTVPRVDKICGPGGLFVQLAKKLVYGLVDIDGLYGPTEAVLLADERAAPRAIARELLAQAEHDPLARALFLTSSRRLAREVSLEVEGRLPGLERSEIVRQALDRGGGIVLVKGLEEGIGLINAFAPEHVALFLEEPWPWVEKIENAGGIFLGAVGALGDYMAGPSHVLPTGGTARFASPLGVGDFLKLTSVVALEEKERKRLSRRAAVIARAEGLTAHAEAMEED